jgi:hypothetical protein
MATIQKRGDRWRVQIRRKGRAPVSRTFRERRRRRGGRENRGLKKVSVDPGYLLAMILLGSVRVAIG